MAVVEEETTGQLVWNLVSAIIRLVGMVAGIVFVIKGLYADDHVEAIRYLITGGLVVWMAEKGKRDGSN